MNQARPQSSAPARYASAISVEHPPRTSHDAETIVFDLAMLQGPHAAKTAVGPSPARRELVERGHADPLPVRTPDQTPRTASGLRGERKRAPGAASDAAARGAAGRTPELARGSRPPGRSQAAKVAVGPSAAELAPPARPAVAVTQPRPAAEPEAPEAFGLVRRIALQRSLEAATALLQTGLGELAGVSVALVFVGANGAAWAPVPEAMTAAVTAVGAQRIATCAVGREILVCNDEHALLVPISTTTPAALITWRPATGEKIAPTSGRVIGTVASRLAVLDHFLAERAASAAQDAADAASMYRPQALAAARARHRESDLVHLTPRWIRIAIPTVVLISAMLLICAAVIQVPTYSRGPLVVQMNGRNVMANASGRIAEILVTPGQRVAVGDPLIALDTADEALAFEQVDTVYRDQLATFLSEPSDEAARQSLAGILASHVAAHDRLGAKTIRAPIDGVVSSVLVTDQVSEGEQLLTIIPDGSEPSVLAFLPGSDRSRLAPGMTLQLELSGYSRTREMLEITEVEPEVLGQAQARKRLGQKLGDSIALPSSVVVVKAKLSAMTFESAGTTYHYFDGMDGLAEIQVDTKSFLSVVFGTGD